MNGGLNSETMQKRSESSMTVFVDHQAICSCLRLLSLRQAILMPLDLIKDSQKLHFGERFSFVREFIEEDDRFLATDSILMQSNEGGDSCAENCEKACEFYAKVESVCSFSSQYRTGRLIGLCPPNDLSSNAGRKLARTANLGTAVEIV